MKTFEGKLVSKDIRIGIVAARFNEFITSKLLSGSLDALKRHEVGENAIDIAWVPGAFEIPLIASKMANSGKYDDLKLKVTASFGVATTSENNNGYKDMLEAVDAKLYESKNTGRNKVSY